jgi:hypothetical protein
MDASRKSTARKHLSQSGSHSGSILGGLGAVTQERPDASFLTAAEREAEFGRLFLAAVHRLRQRDNHRPKRSKTQLQSAAK